MSPSAPVPPPDDPSSARRMPCGGPRAGRAAAGDHRPDPGRLACGGRGAGPHPPNQETHHVHDAEDGRRGPRGRGRRALFRRLPAGLGDGPSSPRWR